MTDKDKKHLNEMLQAAQKVLTVSSSLKNIEDLYTNKLRYDTILYNLVVIAEAESKLSDTAKKQTADINWHKIEGYNNELRSDFHQIDRNMLWKVITEEVSVLKEKLEKILKSA